MLPKNILQEIRRNIEVYNANYISFWDDLTFASLPQAERFADAIIESGLKFYWSAAIRVDLFGNPKKDYEKRVERQKKRIPNALHEGLDNDQCSLEGVDDLYDTSLDPSVCVPCHK